MRRWLPASLPSELARASAVVVYLPGNDASPGADDVRALHARLVASTSAPVIWALPPRWPDGHANASIVEAIAGAQIRAGVPLLTPGRVQLAAADLARDGVHLTVAGSERLAATWPAPPAGGAGESGKPPPAAGPLNATGPGGVVAVTFAIALWLAMRIG